jgi:hypothetical protein
MMAGHGVGRHSAVMLRQLGQKRLAKKQQKHQRHIAYYRVIKQQSEILIGELHQVSNYSYIMYSTSLKQIEREICVFNNWLNSAAARLRSAKIEHGVPQSSHVYFRPTLLISVRSNLFSFYLLTKD